MTFDPPFVLLEDRLDRSSPARLYSRPVRVARADEPQGVDGAFETLEAGLRAGLHAAGFFAYELGYLLEPRLRPLLPADRSDPLIWMGLFETPRLLTSVEMDEAFGKRPPPPPLTDIAPGHDRATHVAKVERVLALIRAGDIYQANVTFPVRFHYDGDPLSLYAALRSRQPTAHGGMVATGDAWVLSVSPELFLSIEGGVVESRPMKGTAPRGRDAAADAAAVRDLVADPKQRAENLMITDLIRNDLGRICAPGSVRVPRLFTPETHPTFHALTSTVTGRLRANTSLRERVAAVFPCGSIVGAPKVRAAEILADLEAAPRGVYTGSIGSLAPDGRMDLNVAIRTAVIRPDGSGTYGVGGGIVADSSPGAEYDEARLKSRVLEDLAADYGLIETFRWSAQTGFLRLAGHLGRLASSATALGFIFDRPAAEGALARRAGDWLQAGREDRRVRLLLARTGALTIEDADAPKADQNPARIGFATAALDAADPFARHKTTVRMIYDAASAEAEAMGWDEALILNRAGEIADGARHTLFAQIGGRLLTPPITAGALPGVLRREWIEAGYATETPIMPEDLRAADKVFIGNSLRGMRPASLAL